MMPLMLAPIFATDVSDVIYCKMKDVNVYINRRSLLGKSVNQAVIRKQIFNLVAVGKVGEQDFVS